MAGSSSEEEPATFSAPPLPPPYAPPTSASDGAALVLQVEGLEAGEGFLGRSWECSKFLLSIRWCNFYSLFLFPWNWTKISQRQHYICIIREKTP